MTRYTLENLVSWLAVHGTIRGAADEAADEAAVDPAVALAAEIAELKEQVAEGQRTAQYWQGRASAVPAAPAAAAADPEDDTDVLEAITTGGAKGFDALAAKRGFVKRDEVESLINQRAATLTTEQELIQRFPDLRKKDSEFFKATSLHYGELLKAGTPQQTAMSLAADKAELDFLRSGKIKLPGSAPTREEKEEARLARIAAQAGGGSGARPAASGEDDGELDAQQLHIVRSTMVGYLTGKDGKPMQEAEAIERYKGRAKSGVSVKGSK